MDVLSLRAARYTADVLCPERCAACPALVPSTRLFCPPCQSHVSVLGPPECLRCGLPVLAGSVCATCVPSEGSPVRHARAWAAYRGDGDRSPLAAAVAAFKYGGAVRLGRRFAAAMVARVPDRTISIIAPIPLHPRKLRTRGYNQSAVLARHIARILARPAALQLLRRTRDTPSQTSLSAPVRAANVADAFTVYGHQRLDDRSVLLVDDVWTSGATARATAAALRAAGARAVDVLTLARVL